MSDVVFLFHTESRSVEKEAEPVFRSNGGWGPTVFIVAASSAIPALPSFSQMSIDAGYLESTKKVGSVSSSQNGFYFGVVNTQLTSNLGLAFLF